MTTETDELLKRISDDGEGFVNKEGVPPDAFGDPGGEYPKANYQNQQTVNRAVRGVDVNELDARNGIPNVNTDATHSISSQYPLSQVNESVSGHVIEINDTPGGERIIIKHNNGAGVDIRPDGTIIVNAKNHKVEVAEGDRRLVVEGNGDISYYGNLNMNVSGDYNLEIGGNYNLTVNGNWIANIFGSYKKKVIGLMSEVVNKSKSVIVIGYMANTFLSNYYNIVKGTFQSIVQGKSDYNHGDVVLFNAEKEIDISSPNINIAATDLAVIGEKGTIGGKDMIGYYNNVYLENTLHAKTTQQNAAYATTFHGSLNGTAKQSIESSVAGGIGIVQIEDVSIDSTSSDTTATVQPNGGIITDLLQNNEIGVKKVSVDRNDEIKNYYDKDNISKGITNRELNLKEVRSKLKDKNHLSNTTFVTDRIAAGVLAETFSNGIPGGVDRMAGKNPTVKTGNDIIGQSGISKMNSQFKAADSASKPRSFTYAVDSQFNPQNKTVITASTLLGTGIPISKFTGGTGNKVTLNHITSFGERQQIARNLYVQSQIIKTFYDLGTFKGYNLVVAEGLYQPGPGETTSGFNKLAEKGQAVAYEVYSTNGTIALDKLYELAELLRDTYSYDKLGLNYDTFNPSGEIHGQLTVEIPSIGSDFTAAYSMNLETVFNGDVQSSSDLIEVTA